MVVQKLVVLFLLVSLALLASCGAASQDEDGDLTTKLEPTYRDITYGPHERNKLDLYLAESEKPAPLVLFIHGGGFFRGDKSNVNVSSVRSYLDAGFSVAALNYRLTDSAPAPAAYLDCARALQFLRHHASRWNLDPDLVASTGGSAGAGTSMWLAFRDDLAVPDSEDPIARQSTRLVCVAVYNGQSSYDPRFAEKIGIPRPNFERHDFFLPFYGISAEEIDSPEAYRLYEQAAPITYVTADDPPVLLTYGFPNEEVDENSSLDLVVHHPKFGIALKERLDGIGIECIVQYRDSANQLVRHGSGDPVQPVDFIARQFELVAAGRHSRAGR
ncbi:MAG TPA: alpha/beta hydrolase [Acidobacteriota bacterium]|nr:alpha/beta hydrolase [Acidobacteriota bacterium]